MPVPPYLARIYKDRGCRQFLGTGILVARDRLLTCKHVVEPPSRVMAVFGEGEDEIRTVARLPHSDRLDERHDLALLDLEKHCGDPPPWSNESFQDATVDIYGFERGEYRDIPECKGRTHLDRNRQVIRVEVPDGIPEGCSGAAAVRLVSGVPHCVAMICLGGEGASKSVLRGGGVIAPFLARHGVPLPGWAPIGGTAPPPPPPDPSAYLAWLRRKTERIDIRGFADATKAHTFPIEDIYIALQNAQGKGLEGLLKRRRCLVIQGDAGSGKSTFLQHLAHRYSGGKKRFPILVRVVDLDNFIAKNRAAAGTPVSDDDPGWIACLLGWMAAAENWRLPAPYFEEKMRERNTLVLLDGLDETPDPARRKSMADLFARAADRYACSFLLTARPGAYAGDGRPREIASDAIVPLDRKATDKFLAAWSRCVHGGDTEAAERHRRELSEQMGATQEVQDLASSPMMLTALAVIHWNEKRLPDDRADLYSSILKWLVRSRENKPGRAAADECFAALQAIAYGMQTNPEGRLKTAERGQALGWIGNVKGGAAAFLDREELDSGIVVSRGDGIEFRHLTFQEYLAAMEFCGLTEREQKAMLGSPLRYGVEWREFLCLTALCLKTQGRKKLNLFCTELLNACGPTLEDRARTVAILGRVTAEVRGFEPTDGRYAEYVRDMVRLFDPAEAHSGLDMWTRAAAAEVWERLDDVSRLPLPHETRYWVRVGRFEIGKYPVTVHEYARFVAAGGSSPHHWQHQLRYRNRPVVCVSFQQADGYCRWLREQDGCPGVRLPTEEEWFSVAMGTNKQKWPLLLVEPDASTGDYNGGSRPATPVGLFPTGTTGGMGIPGLAGNVWELTSDPDDAKRGWYSSRASYPLGAWVRRLAARDVCAEDGVGFRIIRKPPVSS